MPLIGRGGPISAESATASAALQHHRQWSGLFAALAGATVAAGFLLTVRHLMTGVDLRNESFSILVPWRWALGDTPFVNEENLAQVSGLLSYPFVKAFELFRGGDATGLVLYTRAIHVFLMTGVAATMFLTPAPALAMGARAPGRRTVCDLSPAVVSGTQRRYHGIGVPDSGDGARGVGGPAGAKFREGVRGFDASMVRGVVVREAATGDCTGTESFAAFGTAASCRMRSRSPAMFRARVAPG